MDHDNGLPNEAKPQVTREDVDTAHQGYQKAINSINRFTAMLGVIKDPTKVDPNSEALKDFKEIEGLIGHDGAVKLVKDRENKSRLDRYDKELDWRQKQIEYFKSQDVVPATDQEIVAVVDAISSLHAVDVSSSAYQYVNEKVSKAQTSEGRKAILAEIARKAQINIESDQRNFPLLEAALEMQKGIQPKDRLLEQQLQRYLNRSSNPWTIDQLVASLQGWASLRRSQKADSDEYASALDAVKKLPGLKRSLEAYLQSKAAKEVQADLSAKEIKREPVVLVDGRVPEISLSNLNNEVGKLDKITHSGTEEVYIAGEDGAKVVKLKSIKSMQSGQMEKEVVLGIKYMKSLQQAGRLDSSEGTPRILATIADVYGLRGMVMERIFGKSFDKLSEDDAVIRGLTAQDKIALIYDLADWYSSTGFSHGDLFYVDNINGKRSLRGNCGNLMYDEQARKIRFIDPLAPKHADINLSDGRAMRDELTGMVEYLFMGRLKGPGFSALPKSGLEDVGQQILDNIDQVKKPEDVYKIIPPKFIQNGRAILKPVN